MFHRASALLVTCSQCRPTRFSSAPLAISHPLRWQSAVAAQNVDEPEIADESQDNITSPTDAPNTPSSTQHVRPSSKQKLSARWRPHKAEKLGVNVLGKPAEVIIVPSRERKAAEAILEEKAEWNKADLQKSLDSESKPVSRADIFRNIESLKADLGKDKQTFSTSEWDDCERRLAEGFTKSQLQEYLQSAIGDSVLTANGSFPRSGRKEKRKIAANIMLKAWKWTTSDATGVVAETQAKSQSTSKFFTVPVSKLGYIMLHEKQKLGHWSESFGVQIDIFKKRSKLRVIGTVEAVGLVRKELNELTKSLRESTLKLSSQLGKLLGDGTKPDAILAMMMNKHKMFISKDRDHLQIASPRKADADMVLRDLLLMSVNFRTTTHSRLCWDQGQGRLACVPFRVSDQAQQHLRDRVWVRHVSTEPSVRVENGAKKSGHGEIEKAISSLLPLAKPGQKRISQYLVVPGSLCHEYAVDLGQVLFTVPQVERLTENSAPMPQITAESQCVLRQGLLPQVLRRMSLHATDGSGESQSNMVNSVVKPFLLHLRLRPITPTQVSPPLELFLKGQDINLGLNQPLEIKRVFAVVDQWQYNLLLPHQSVDMAMSRQSRIDLLGHPGTKNNPAYLNILRQVGSHLERTQALDNTDLPPIWRLDVSSLLKKSAPGEQDATKDPGSTQSKVEANTRVKSATTYVLEPPEYLDIASYKSPTTSDRHIDHIICDTKALDHPHQRQRLRIGADTLSDLFQYSEIKSTTKTPTATVQQQEFKKSIMAAYDMAVMLRDVEHAASERAGPLS